MNVYEVAAIFVAFIGGFVLGLVAALGVVAVRDEARKARQAEMIGLIEREIRRRKVAL
jgi:hypothetical protein